MSTMTRQVEISNYLGKLLRDNFGKGPESVYVSIGSCFFTIYLRNFLSPMERVLLEQEQEITVLQTRDLLMEKLLHEFKAYMKQTTGREIAEIYYDWNLQNRSGMVAGITSEPFEGETAVWEEYSGKEMFHQEINELSREAEKTPDEVYSYLLNDRTLIVIRQGLLVRIEKELIRLGYTETLTIAKRYLEKGMLHHHYPFKEILRREIREIFVDWNYDLDKSMLVFILEPTT